MLRVRPACAPRSNNHSTMQRPTSSPAVHRAYSESRERLNVSRHTKPMKDFEITKLERFPPVERIDLQKASKNVRRSMNAAQDLAQKRKIAIEGPPSDSLESLLAMRIQK